MLPVALTVMRHGGAGHPDDQPAQFAQFFCQPVDRFADTAGCSHFGGRSGRAEHVLHVDNDKGRLAGIERVEQVVAAAARQHAVNDLLTDGYLMHIGIFSLFGSLRRRERMQDDIVLNVAERRPDANFFGLFR